MTTPRTNWAGNIRYSAQEWAHPAGLDELRGCVARARQVRAVGSGHSFNRIADTSGTLVVLDRMPLELEVDSSRLTVRASAHWTLEALCTRLQQAGLALHNLPSLPHISLAGAVATATHGSGRSHPSLAGAVRAVEFLAPDGSTAELRGSDEEFHGAVVSLGALGVVTHLELAVHPTYSIEQYVHDGPSLAELAEHAPQILSCANSVSIFTDGAAHTRIWVKKRAEEPLPDLTWAGATSADGPRHPVPGISTESCTEQLGSPGPWFARLPHFRADATPSAGEELQTEYFVPYAETAPALRQLARLQPLFAHVLRIAEVRSVASEPAWLSMAHDRESTALHFTWLPDEAGVAAVLPELEAALAPFTPRPHWAKVFRMPTATLRAGYPRWDDFARLLQHRDPEGKFRTPFIDALFGEDARRG